MEDKYKMYKVAVNTVDLEGNKLVYYTHVYAVTNFHAIEVAVTRYRDIQPNREHYSIVSNWDRETGQVIALLTMSAISYIANFPS